MIKDIITKKFKKTTLGGCLIEKINKTLIISREKSSKNLTHKVTNCHLFNL